MIAYYLDYVLDEEQMVEVQLAVGEPVEPVRVPWLVALDDARPLEARHFLPQLQRAGIGEQSGRRVLLVVPSELRWTIGLVEAMRDLTGQWPLLVQPPERRAEAGCPGPLRIVDVEAYMMGEDAAAPPPWLDGDGPPLL